MDSEIELRSLTASLMVRKSSVKAELIGAVCAKALPPYERDMAMRYFVESVDYQQLVIHVIQKILPRGDESQHGTLQSM